MRAKGLGSAGGTVGGTIGGAVIVRADVTARKKGEREVAYLAHHDMLTGADNWQHFYTCATHTLAEADAEMDALSLFYFDLDGFRAVNDEYGYAAGDELLRAVVSRLRAQSRGCDLLARFGGDEFVMLMRGVTQAQGESIVQRAPRGARGTLFRERPTRERPQFLWGRRLPPPRRDHRRASHPRRAHGARDEAPGGHGFSVIWHHKKWCHKKRVESCFRLSNRLVNFI